jgi:hypothetical protein
MIRNCAILAALVLLAAACGPSPAPVPGPEIGGDAPAVESAPGGLVIVEAGAPGTSAPAVEAPREIPPPTVVAYVTVVDLHGQPLQGMNPLVTAQPNAFDEPIAVGKHTGGDGKSWVRFLSDETRYVRAWDPNLQWFPNNFYEIPADASAVARDMVIAMVPAANMDAEFFLPGGVPAASTRIEMMMIHPEWGPWWPAEIVTDPQGGVIVPSLPPGKYTVTFQGPAGSQATLLELLFPPGDTLHLGQVPLL